MLKRTATNLLVTKLRRTVAANHICRSFNSTGILQSSIMSIDCNYMNLKHRAYVFLIKEKDSVAFVDTNTSKAVPFLLDTLRKNNIAFENVKYIIITHVHLDHVGGASELMTYCPNAKIIVHPKGNQHLVNPERLIHSATQVYGKQKFQELYGDIKPISKVSDEELIYLSENRPLKFIFTLGHAKHHIVVYDKLTKSIFTGDSFGISYRSTLRNYFKFPLTHQPVKFQSNNYNPFSVGMRDLLFPSATYPDFDYENAHLSINKIVATGAEQAYITHGGIWESVKEGADQLHAALYEYENIVWKLIEFIKYSNFNSNLDLLSNDIENLALSKMKLFFKNALIQHGYDETNEEIYNFLSNDIKLNAQGIAMLAKNMYLKQIKQ